MPKQLTVIGFEGFPLVKVGDDIGGMIVELAEKQGLSIEGGDIVVVAQKIVSKAEGRVVSLRNVRLSDKAEELAQSTLRDARLIELVLMEAKRILKASVTALIVETKEGLVCLNAGIDKSNVPGEDSYALLPEDADKSAEKIRNRIQELTKKRLAVIVCDTQSRPFRRGQVELAIGVAGIKPFKDYRGQKDLFRYTLRFKNVAVADEIASAAELVLGQGAEGVPVAIVRGIEGVERSEKSRSSELIMSEEDMFRGVI